MAGSGRRLPVFTFPGAIDSDPSLIESDDPETFANHLGKTRNREDYFLLTWRNRSIVFRAEDEEIDVTPERKQICWTLMDIGSSWLPYKSFVFKDKVEAEDAVKVACAVLSVYHSSLLVKRYFPHQEVVISPAHIHPRIAQIVATYGHRGDR